MVVLGPLAAFAAGESPPVAPASAVDREWLELQTLYREPIAGSTPAPSKAEAFRRLDEKSLRFLEAADKFVRDHPDDARKWELIRQIFSRIPRGYVEFKLGFEETPYAENAVVDHATRQHWLAIAEGLKAEMDANPTVPPEIKEQTETTALYVALSSAFRTGAPVDVEALRRRLDNAVSRFPQSERIASMERVYFMVLEVERPREVEAYLAQLKGHWNLDLRRFAEGKQLLIRARAHGLDLSFTSLDGREVDLAKLRGKVVLIDFWATWCGPCIEELPNVKRVYAAYRDRGFEVIGISLDKAQDRQKLIDYITKNDLPWPQHFDGGYWKNAIASKYGVNSIPAMLLVDQQGKLVTTEARGPKLETEVKRLLGL